MKKHLDVVPENIIYSEILQNVNIKRNIIIVFPLVLLFNKISPVPKAFPVIISISPVYSMYYHNSTQLLYWLLNGSTCTLYYAIIMLFLCICKEM